MKAMNPPTSTNDIIHQLLEHSDFQFLKNDPDAFSQELSGLESPIWIPSMEKAVSYLKEALSQKSSILVIGDRDVDGVSSTALLGNFLEKELVQKGGHLELIVSDDGDDYGLSGDVFKRAQESRADLVVLLDMGSSNGPEVLELVKTKKVIILDHHQLHDRLPDPDLCAFVNPMRYITKDTLTHRGKISTSGIVFKLLLAYAFSFTNEWLRIYKIHDAKTQKDHFFRLGQYFDTQESLDNHLETIPLTDPSYVVLSESSNPTNLHLTNEEWKRIFSQPMEAGSLLVCGAIRSRTKLHTFVVEISKLAAIGLVTDMVPLCGENRSVVKLGFSRSGHIKTDSNSHFNIGFQTLMKKIKLPIGSISSKDAGWSIGPAINAAGRMGNTRMALDLLTAQDETRARDLATKLLNLNTERKERTAYNEGIVKDYFKNNSQKSQEPVIFCYHPDLKKGVSGIVATRLTETYQKPTVYINRENEIMAKGSARSWGGINVLHLIDTCSDLFEQFGGHPEAAGFSLRIDHIDAFEKKLIQEAHKGFKQVDSSNQSPFHIEVPLRLMGPELFAYIDRMEPFGSDNPEPKLHLKSIQTETVKTMSNGLHVKFTVKNVSRSIDFVVWKKAQQFLKEIAVTGSIDVVGALEKNYFAGRTRLQFRIESFGNLEA